MARILVGLSGGVDSAVAAALLRRQGHDIVGAYMKNWINEENIAGHCPWMEDIEDARAVAEKLGIEFRVVNLMRDYRERVVKYLLEGYESGITPNPDVMCNREMKYGVFLDYALDNGFEAVATGHYCRRRSNTDGTFDLLRGVDDNKDQSYFLALVNQRQLSCARFPVGELRKPEVRALADELDLPNAKKKDSQGICFIGEVKMSDFLREFVADSPGDIVDIEGRKLGRHQGLHLYTLGQRKGHGIASPRYGVAYVVVAKNAGRNELVVGYDEPVTPGLYASRCTLTELSFPNDELTGKVKVLAQARYRTSAEPATLTVRDDGKADLVFDAPQRALTPGQICAIYDLQDEALIAGSVFAEIL